MAERRERQVAAGEQEAIGRHHVEHPLAVGERRRRIGVEPHRAFRIGKLQRQAMHDVAEDQEVAARRRHPHHAVADGVAVAGDRADARREFGAVLVEAELAGGGIGFDGVDGEIEEAAEFFRRLAANIGRSPERVVVLVDVERRVRKQHLVVAGDDAGDVVGMRMGDDDGVDRGGTDAGRGKVLRQPADARREMGAAAGIDQDELLAGIDQPGVERRGEPHLGQMGVAQQLLGARFVAGEDGCVQRQGAVAHHRHLVISDFLPVEPGRLLAGNWRCHVILP